MQFSILSSPWLIASDIQLFGRDRRQPVRRVVSHTLQLDLYQYLKPSLGTHTDWREPSGFTIRIRTEAAYLLGKDSRSCS